MSDFEKLAKIFGDIGVDQEALRKQLETFLLYDLEFNFNNYDDFKIGDTPVNHSIINISSSYFKADHLIFINNEKVKFSFYEDKKLRSEVYLGVSDFYGSKYIQDFRETTKHLGDYKVVISFDPNIRKDYLSKIDNFKKFSNECDVAQVFLELYRKFIGDKYNSLNKNTPNIPQVPFLNPDQYLDLFKERAKFFNCEKEVAPILSLVKKNSIKKQEFVEVNKFTKSIKTKIDFIYPDEAYKKLLLTELTNPVSLAKALEEAEKKFQIYRQDIHNFFSTVSLHLKLK